MICATPCIVSFDKYFKQHQGIFLLWFICQQATRESFSRPLWRLWCLGQNLLPCSCGRSKSNSFQLPSYDYNILSLTSCHNIWRSDNSPVYLMFQLGFVKCLELCFALLKPFLSSLILQCWHCGSIPVHIYRNAFPGILVHVLSPLSLYLWHTQCKIWLWVQSPASMWRVTAAIVFPGLAWAQRLNKGN